ncbi:RNI-like protein [Artomyces pyxidatus]|uniref:RNI-like protein n=1 Tax=Artomyces pyxidatus TaxID=48021 RepID=A0ACB8T7F5_9AGAM|nr:RNI-like protein [Artomyces pyxidatus]
MSSSVDLPAVGVRVNHAGSIGTVKYVGEVDGTKGTWLGVEWDDPNRGKHDGVKDGKRYFSCSIPGAGSFIRPLPSLDYGRSFLRALVEKYVEMPHGTTAQEMIVLGSSNGSIQVEAVNLNKIRGNLARLDRLREVSLDTEGVSSADEPGQIREKCTSVRGVDLSFSLVPTWDTIALIAIELPMLERLALNNNRLRPFTNPSVAARAFQHLTELQLNANNITWQGMLDVVSLIPTLKHIEMGYNHLTTLSVTAGSSGDVFSSALETINLDSNSLSNWSDICFALKGFNRLSRLIVSANPITTITPMTPLQEPAHIRHLALSHTRISAWSSIDALSVWCPRLETLSLTGTPLVEDPETGRAWRQIAIARVPSLRVLDGASISQRQRNDAELFYLSHVSRLEFASDDARLAAHPQWAALCERHGAPDTSHAKATKDDKLSDRLIQIKATLSSISPPPESPTALPPSVAVRVLPTASLRLLRLKLLKVFKAPRGASAAIWVRMADGKLAAIGEPGGDDGRELDWWLEEGCEIVVHVKESQP